MSRKAKYNKEILSDIAAKVTSIAELLRGLGLKQAGGNHRHISNLLSRFEINTKHFTGSAWNKGKTYGTDVRVKATAHSNRKYSDAEAFCKNSPLGGEALRKRILRSGRVYKCVVCGISEWLNKEIALHLDHKNGVCDDNRKCNLRFLCPNCHQQTNTWGARNRKRHIMCPNGGMQTLQIQSLARIK
jgi:hypothetical protein